MAATIHNLEQKRLAIQADLDAGKTQEERNRLGQFATPTILAQDILRYAASLLPEGEKVRFLDPAIGTGSFFSALRTVFTKRQIAEALGFEIDSHYGLPAKRLWKGAGLKVELADFTQQEAFPRFNLIICNPPYVRHHHIQNGQKARIQMRTAQACGCKIGGLAGLYCYFLGLSHAWMAPDAVAGWLIPSEFMDVNYGRAIKHYLLKQVTLLHIHRFDPGDAQFADALVSSAVVWFRNAPPPASHAVEFTFGGTLAKPKLSRMVTAEALAHEHKWTRFPAADIRQRGGIPMLGDFFKIKRGLATGDNSFFILSAEEVAKRGLPQEALRPILPGPRYVPDEVDVDVDGTPRLERRLFLIDPRFPEDEIEARFPALWAYLNEGKARHLHEAYLCSHRRLWYIQENRPPAPIVCTYMGRADKKNGPPFRFILNHSQATVANVYLAMYPTPPLARAMADDPGLIRRVWQALNRITPDQLLAEGRVYGGGLHKLEPKELANVPVSEIAAMLPKAVRPATQGEMFAEVAAE
jgi:hypothetical protein